MQGKLGGIKQKVVTQQAVEPTKLPANVAKVPAAVTRMLRGEATVVRTPQPEAKPPEPKEKPPPVFPYKRDWRSDIPRDSRLWIQKERPPENEDEEKAQAQVTFDSTFMSRISERLRPHPYRPLRPLIEDALRHNIGFVPTIDPLEVAAQSDDSGRDDSVSGGDTSSDETKSETLSLMSLLSHERGRRAHPSLTELSEMDHEKQKKRAERKQYLESRSVLDQISRPWNSKHEKERNRMKHKRLMDYEEAKDFCDCFTFFDRSNAGMLPVKYIGLMLRAMGQFYTSSEIEDLQKELGEESHFTVNEFLEIGAARFAEVPEGSVLLSAFKILDRFNKDQIDAGHLRHMMTTVRDKLTTAEFDELLSTNDVRKDQQRFAFSDIVKLLMGPRSIRYPSYLHPQ